MAKKVDPFEKFRDATLGYSNELSDAIRIKHDPEPIQEEQVIVPAAPQPEYVENTTVTKVSKNASRELVSFHIDKTTKKLLGLLKYEQERSFGDLYIEAIEDLLRKYGKLS